MGTDDVVAPAHERPCHRHPIPQGYFVGQKETTWVTYSPLVPLALLLFTGLYMFVLPYTARGRSARRSDG